MPPMIMTTSVVLCCVLAILCKGNLPTPYGGVLWIVFICAAILIAIKQVQRLHRGWRKQ